MLFIFGYETEEREKEEMSQIPQFKDSSGPNTLLKQLGFSDKDRANPRHDLAVAYALKNKERLLDDVFSGSAPLTVSETIRVQCACRYDYPSATQTLVEQAPEQVVYAGAVEHALFRPDMHRPGERSSFIVGFADAVLVRKKRIDCVYECRKCKAKADETREREELALVEVKITPESAGNVLRQLETYRQGACGMSQARFVLLVDYAVSEADAELYKNKSVLVRRLGAGFEDFIKAASSASAELGDF